MKKNNIKRFLIIVIIVVASSMLIFSSFKIYAWYKDSANIKEITEKIQSEVEISEVGDSDENVIIPEPKVQIPEENPYWDYIEMDLIDVDFQNLKKINSDVVGWLQVKGTNINYPFVQTNNNDYYLTHSFDKSYNEAGWVFMDYRNNKKNFDQNTIIYAHGRADKIMFNSLKNLLKSDWYNNLANHIIKISQEKVNSMWQVFSVYHIKTTNDYITKDFNSDEEFLNFIKMLKDRSVYEFNVDLGVDDKILTLSTCYTSQEKMVMHAKLIKYQVK